MPHAWDTPQVTVLIATRDRPALLLQALQSVLRQKEVTLHVVVLDDGSQHPVSLDHEIANLLSDPRFVWLRVEAPLGVAGTRNRLFAHANTPVAVVLDDDATVETDDALARIVAAFEDDPKVGFVALNVTNVTPQGTYPSLPFRRRLLRKRPALAHRRATIAHFQGMAHALRVSAFSAVGGYDAKGIYGHEELELCYRLLDAGYEGRYLPDVPVKHQPQSMHGTSRQDERTRHLIRNRIRIAWRLLPFRYAVVHILVWLIFDLRRATRSGTLVAYAQGILGAVRSLPSTPRTPVSSRTIAYLKAHGGRLWY